MESITSNNLKIDVTNKQILSIALPISISILIPQLNVLINSIFLSRLDVTGEALGNAGITGVFYLIFAVAGHGLNNAMQSVFSNNAGSGNHQNFKTILTQGLRISLIFAAIGILFTWLVAPYIMQQVATAAAYPQEMNFLRIRILGLPFLFFFQMGNALLISTLNSKYLMYGFIAETGLNILLDYLLIFGHFGMPELGFNGAAVASVIAEFGGMVVVFSVIFLIGIKKKYGLLQNFKYDKFFSRKILNVSLPLVTQYVISVTTWLVFFLLIENRGEKNAKAISNLMRSVFGISGVFIWAFAATCNNMVSNLIGQDREDEVLKTINRITAWSVGLCLISVSLLNIFPATFFKLFNADAAFIAEGISVIRIVSLGMIFMSIANIWLNGLTGTGKTKTNLFIEIFAISFYMIYTWYVMKVHYTSLAMAWSNEFVYWTTIFVMAFFYMRSGRWKRPHPNPLQRRGRLED
jgi:multidrug resistance protein, MATE family